MNREIIVNAGSYERRIAIVEDGKLDEFLIERQGRERLHGNIYLGTVRNVQPGMQAAFVDIGLEKTAFLSFSDFHASSLIEIGSGKADGRSGARRSPNPLRALRRGGHVLVQIIKEPIGTKGAKVTMQLSFAGRFVVLLSGTNFVGISKRTRNYTERRGLKQLIYSVKPDGVGIIVRTIGLAAEEGEFKNEIRILHGKYSEILKTAERTGKPKLLHREMELTASVMRDLFTRDITGVVVDTKDQFKEIRKYLKSVDPEMCGRMRLYKGKDPIFDHYGIEKEIDRILRRKVWLKSGGYLVFDHTEALVSIDVNSGRYVGKKNLEETYLRINMEAVQEVARQVRLRDIGGLIVVDLIDMEIRGNRTKVYQAICRQMKRDKAAHNILPINDFGLLEISRKRVRPEVVQIMSEVCPACGGIGSVFSQETVITRIDRCLRRNMAAKGPKKIALEVCDALHDYLIDDRKNTLKKLMKENKVKLELYGNEEFNSDDFRIYNFKSMEEITENLR